MHPSKNSSRSNIFDGGRRQVLAVLARCGIGLAFAGWASGALAESDTVRTIGLKIEKGTLTNAGPGNVVRVKEGESLAISWSTDEAVKLHLHGYDIEITVQPGIPGIMKFKAFASGRFPISQHSFGADGKAVDKGNVGYLEVLPR